MRKIIIAGSRSFNDYNFLKNYLNDYFENEDFNNIEIVNGNAIGADILGKRYAIENRISLKTFHANWGKYGKKAGYLRNLEMSKYANECIVFWDGISKGSKHMIDIANESNLKLNVVMYNDI